MSESAEKFFCGGCQHAMTWKNEFVGRRIKCKHCGHAMPVPAQPGRPNSKAAAHEAQEEDLYALADLAADARTAAAGLPPTIVEAVAAPALAAAGAPARPRQNAIPLAYRMGATTRDTQRAVESSHIDPKRDLYAPVSLLLAGTVLYISYYAIHYNLGGFGIFATSIGLTIMTVIETVILFGFALVIAGPLGVSFGGVGTALLKLAAIAVFCDGVTTWADGLFAKFAGNFGSGGLLSFGVIGLPVALCTYWALLTYLFSMEADDSWMVVIILAIFYRIVRLILVLVLLKFVLSFGGVAASSVALPAMGGNAGPINPVIDEINNAKAQNLLHEARKYCADTSRGAEAGTVNDWYAAEALNVWFETDRDINGHGNPFRMVVELPDDKTQRAACYTIAKKYFNNMGEAFMAQGLQDHGDPYLLVPLP